MSWTSKNTILPIFALVTSTSKSNKILSPEWFLQNIRPEHFSKLFEGILGASEALLLAMCWNIDVRNVEIFNNY